MKRVPLANTLTTTEAVQFVCKMRGGAQSHLFEGGDGGLYVVKFSNNPQGQRILINEWIASRLLAHLDISAPRVALVRISEEFLREHKDIYIQTRNGRQQPLPGWHFGSRFPYHPASKRVYNIVPERLLLKVENLSDFLGVLVFDKWVGNTDSRQAIFFRARLNEWLPLSRAHPLQVGVIAQMVDNGYIFDGCKWQLTDSPLAGLYSNLLVYPKACSLNDFQPWLLRIMQLSADDLLRIIQEIPSEWLRGDENLQRLLDRLMARRKRLPDLIEASVQAISDPSALPRWETEQIWDKPLIDPGFQGVPAMNHS